MKISYSNLIYSLVAQVRKKNEELKMMAEKKRFEEEAKQKQIEAEMEQELKRQAQLKLQQQQNQEAVIKFFNVLLSESCFSLPQPVYVTLQY